MTDATYGNALNDYAIDVPLAAFRFAKEIAYPGLDVARGMALLKEIGSQAFAIAGRSGAMVERCQLLSHYLCEVQGFQGNSTSYSDPRNSFLNDVLETKRGIPISLSVLYVYVARQLGIPVYGIGLPGHFIVGIRDAGEDILIDPFHGGRRIFLADCAELIRLSTGYEGPLEAGWFAPLPERLILARMLANLRSSYVAASDWKKAAVVIHLLRQTQPDESEHLRDLGLVYYQLQRLPKAAHYIDAYLRHSPDAADAKLIREGIEPLLDKWVPMN